MGEQALVALALALPVVAVTAATQYSEYIGQFHAVQNCIAARNLFEELGEIERLERSAFSLALTSWVTTQPL